MSGADRLSVPATRRALPRTLSDREQGRLLVIADTLCHGRPPLPSPSGCPSFPRALASALCARLDAFDVIMAVLAATPDDDEAVDQFLRALHDDDPQAFQPVSAVVAGAYLMLPEVKSAIGYPGQSRNPPGLEEAVDQLSDGILDPVIDRGPIYLDPAKR